MPASSAPELLPDIKPAIRAGRPKRILLLEDDVSVAGSLKKELETEGYEVVWAGRGEEGLPLAREGDFDVVLTDFKMPGLSGLDVISQILVARPKLPIILMTAYGTTDLAIEATKLGAYEYLLKPFEMDELLGLIAKAVACNQSVSAPLELGSAEPLQAGIVGGSRTMQSLYKEIGRAAAASVAVLIRGETGTGKELVARAIHQHSARKSQPFIAVNCSSIPETLLESELFGHEQGAFSGALARRIGRFEQAKSGTILLDEIGDLSLAAQVKLLRVLQEKTIHRLGGNEPIPVLARVLAATHRDLEAAVRENQFREDLLYRLSTCTIGVPTLGQRLIDIPDLVKYFLRRFGPDVGVESPVIHVEAVQYLQEQPWPGNVRQLENAVCQALLLARNQAIALEHVQLAYLRTTFQNGPHEQTISAYLAGVLSKAQAGKLQGARASVIEDMERQLFALAMHAAQGNRAQAARWLGVTRTTLREKLIQFGLHAPHAHPDEDALS
jgi:DNA-binding NtrC family response regulator